MFAKEWIIKDNLPGFWQGCPTAAQSVFPVLMRFMDEKHYSFPSEDTISRLCGRDPKTVRTGLEYLKTHGIEVEKIWNKKGHCFNRYKMPHWCYEKGKVFPVFHSIFDGGNWRVLSPAGQSLYPVMRCFGHFNYYEDGAEEVFSTRGISHGEYIKRIHDVYELDTLSLMLFSGLSKNSVKPGLESLIRVGLLESTKESTEEGHQILNVFLRPKGHFKLEDLNKP